MFHLVKKNDGQQPISLRPSAAGEAFELFCRVKKPFKAGNHKCQDNSTLMLIHPEAYTPITESEASFFYSTVEESYLDTRAMERAYLTHVYLSTSGKQVRRTSLYSQLARQYCPSVWNLTYFKHTPVGF